MPMIFRHMEWLYLSTRERVFCIEYSKDQARGLRMVLKEYLLTFMIRVILGAAAILIVNQLLLKAGIDLCVGMNPLSLVAAGVLGLPGVALMYGIAGCRFF